MSRGTGRQGTEEYKMKKTIKIEGMKCPHCEARVRDALSAVDGVTEADVSHEKGRAVVTLSKDVADDVLSKTVTDQGYKVLSVEKTKLFGIF